MVLPSPFSVIELENRLGQTVPLAVYHTQSLGREYVFIAALAQQVSSLVAKNAEPFAFQLRELFQLDARRLEMIEWRGSMQLPSLWRWRFDWVGASPILPRCEMIISQNQQTHILSLFNTLGKSPAVFA